MANKKIIATRSILDEDGNVIGSETKHFALSTWNLMATAEPAYHGFSQVSGQEDRPVVKGRPATIRDANKD